MISYLRGTLAEKRPTELVIDVNGIGYLVNIPLSTFDQLENAGSQVRILTYLHVREDAVQLYGFATEAEREMFLLLIDVSGIGPKMAQGILSGLTASELTQAVLEGNLAVLTSISGVGKKTAERLVFELRDRIGRAETAGFPGGSTSRQLKCRVEATVALMSLGYTRASAEAALQTVLTRTAETDLSVEDLVKRALRHAAK